MNLRVRTAPGIDGPIILSAFCPKCRQQAMPMRNGTCGFCDTPIVGDGPTSAVKAARKPVRRNPRITGDDIVAELQRFAVQLGRTPYSREWYVSGRSPSRKTIYRRFGSWAAALEAAGL